MWVYKKIIRFHLWSKMLNNKIVKMMTATHDFHTQDCLAFSFMEDSVHISFDTVDPLLPNDFPLNLWNHAFLFISCSVCCSCLLFLYFVQTLHLALAMSSVLCFHHLPVIHSFSFGYHLYIGKFNIFCSPSYLFPSFQMIYIQWFHGYMS